MYKQVELVFSPRNDVMAKLHFPKGEPEMSEFDSAFLCGVLNKFKPKKILEVGVAGGGTTAIVMQCMVSMGLQFVFRSIDLAEYMEFDGKKEKVGYIANELRKLSPEIGKIDWKLYIGGIAPTFMDSVGGNIDCLIIDTAHVPPGEILDFLSLLPFVKKGGVVVLHDICNNWCSSERYRTRFREMADVTKTLFDAVSGDKYLMKDESAVFRNGHPNIAAVCVTDETYIKIADCFSALTHTWYRMLDKDMLESYREVIFSSDLYDSECRWLFDSAVKINQGICENKLDLKGLWIRLVKAASVLLRGY